MPAMNFWSISSGFSLVLRSASIRPKRSHDNAVSSGSRPRCASSSTCWSISSYCVDEHLAERARVDEAQQPALRERDDDVRVLRRLLARGLGAQQLARHAEVHDEHVGAVELQHEVLAAPLRRDDLAADEDVDELLAVAVPANRPRAGDLHRLDLLADDLALEVAPHDLDLR